MAEILQAPAGFNEQDLIRLGKLNDMIQQGNNPYEITTFDRTHLSSEIISNFDALEGQTVTIAGRMMSRRVMGKASFAHVLDRDGQIQIFPHAGRTVGMFGNTAQKCLTFSKFWERVYS